jgi:hypothetical protein
MTARSRFLAMGKETQSLFSIYFGANRVRRRAALRLSREVIFNCPEDFYPWMFSFCSASPGITAAASCSDLGLARHALNLLAQWHNRRIALIFPRLVLPDSDIGIRWRRLTFKKDR